MVWYQKFEYAVGHWLQKATEHVFGCVLCCPGCFSLFRGSALVDDNVLQTYTREPEEGSHLVQFEQGEDRWLCTLLLKRGYKIDYCAGADAKTFAPEGFSEFFIQRRRWSPSTLANMIDLVKDWRVLVKNNNQISRLFMLYQCVMLATTIFAPATVVILIAGSFNTVLGIGSWYSLFLAVGPVIVFAVSCFLCKQGTQLLIAGVLSSVYAFVMVIVTIGMIFNFLTEDSESLIVTFFLSVALVFVFAGFIHPKELPCLFSGLLYYVTVPSTFIFLTVFFICNMHDVSWGTRERKTDNKTDISIFSMIKDYIVRKLNVEPLTTPNMETGFSTEADGEDIAAAKRNKYKLKRPHTMVHTEAWMNQIGCPNIEPLAASETDFWKKLIEKYLKPLDRNSTLQARFTNELVELRNKCVYGFFMLNLILALAMLQLQVSREKLKGFYFMGKYEPVATLLLVVFTVLLAIQVLGMFKHQWGTFLHLISSTKLTRGARRVNNHTTQDAC